jgi:hypothetical protein
MRGSKHCVELLVLLHIALAVECPGPEWTKFPLKDKCFSVSEQTLSQVDCVKDCGDGSSLAGIQSEEENVFIAQNLLQGAPRGWIGLYRDNDAWDSSDWHWVSGISGSDSRYRHWKETGVGHYSDYGYARKDCGAMESSGKWVALVCSLRLQCVCQFPANITADYPPVWIQDPPLHKANLWGTLCSIALAPLIWLGMMNCCRLSPTRQTRLCKTDQSESVNTIVEFRRSRSVRKSLLSRAMGFSGLGSVAIGWGSYVVGLCLGAPAGIVVGSGLLSLIGVRRERWRERERERERERSESL